MTSSSGTESSEEDENTDEEYSSRRKANLPPKANRKHDNKFKPIGPDSGSFVDVSKAKALNEYIFYFIYLLAIKSC